MKYLKKNEKIRLLNSFYSINLYACWISLAISFCFCTFLLILAEIFIPKSDTGYSFTIYSSDGHLLGAAVSQDGMWRFPQSGKIPEKYKSALLVYEDKNFYFHFGIDPFAVVRAFISNLKYKKIVSGASTITMQTARLISDKESKNERTLKQKIKEAFIALLLELKYSKEEILNLYCSNASYGGNVVGLEAAAHRYFGRSMIDLTWAEAALLAVLPNQPSLIHPGKNADILKEKRNKLLYKLFLRKKINEQTYVLSIAEPIPEKPAMLPNKAMHYLEFLKRKDKVKNRKYVTDLDYDLQMQINKITEQRFEFFSLNGIKNIAVLVLDIETGKILTYIGNSGLTSSYAKNEHVDMIQAKRSSGSLLKPFLFAGMLDAGMLLPEQLLIDVPTKISGYNPQNSTYKYSGAIKANQALAYSLNVPFVRTLRDFTIPAFLDLLKKCGFTTFTRTAEEYGLPLILGGGEITLFEITDNYRKLMLKSMHMSCGSFPLSAGACRLTLEALSECNRPEEEAQWQFYAQKQKIAWKTGTSFGNKDAWTVGVTPKYAVGIWCGNASGEGRPEITSTKTAAPMLFEIFSILPKANWESLKIKDFENIKVCADSGYPAGIFCNKFKYSLKPINSHSQINCPYCKIISVTQNEEFSAFALDVKKFPKITSRFVLPPAAEYFYKQKHPEYISVPPMLSGKTFSDKYSFEILFPEDGSNIFIPIELDGSRGGFSAQAMHKHNNAVIYWDLDGEYLGCTKIYHNFKIQTGCGTHVLTLTDNLGNQQQRIFTVFE